MRLAGALTAAAAAWLAGSLPAAAAAAPAAAAAAAAPDRRRRQWGPPDLQEVCHPDVGCHRFGKLRAPIDHGDPALGDWDLAYFVNSDFWDPVGKPRGPVFISGC
eukprot:SAG22_NODE_379_length_11417_cov_211.325647_5_plen_105_part_00